MSVSKRFLKCLPTHPHYPYRASASDMHHKFNDFQLINYNFIHKKNSDFSSRKVAVVIYIVLLCFYLRDFFDLDFDLLFDFELAVALLLLFLDDDLAAFTEADFDFLELDLVYLDLFALEV